MQSFSFCVKLCNWWRDSARIRLLWVINSWSAGLSLSLRPAQKCWERVSIEDQSTVHFSKVHDYTRLVLVSNTKGREPVMVWSEEPSLVALVQLRDPESGPLQCCPFVIERNKPVFGPSPRLVALNSNPSFQSTMWKPHWELFKTQRTQLPIPR